MLTSSKSMAIRFISLLAAGTIMSLIFGMFANADVVCHAKRKKLTSKIQKIRQGKQHLGGLKLYLNGFIKPFNQTTKHCISIIDTKKASHALLCGVCTNHYNIDGNSLIAIFLYKIQFKY